MKTGLLIATAFALGLAGPAGAKDWTQVTIATEGAFPPYNLHAADGTLVGYEIDLAANLCPRVHLTCTFVSQDWDGIIPGLQAGKFDAIMSGMSITPKRLQVIDFSLPYANSPTTLAVLTDDPLANLPGTGQRVSLDDKAATQAAIDAMKPKLKGKVIAVQVATIQADFLNTYLKDAVDIRTYKSNDEQDLDVHAGRADAELGSLSFLRAAQDKGKDLALSGPLFVGGLLGKGSAIGLRKTDPELKALFDKAIHEAEADGSMKALSIKWFKVDITPTPQS
ncbi:MAG: transporter substrate-binding domain-containing protein [Acetobacteraceae bacterium]